MHARAYSVKLNQLNFSLEMSLSEKYCDIIIVCKQNVAVDSSLQADKPSNASR